ncbi:hypothetical protein Pcaca04_15270 [Pectobacterium carotovorum subsp. carotovorum]|nr:hypothetical protein Pcaca04_15270 [Pectobacterium carotovorum subsp. carotovorum]
MPVPFSNRLGLAGDWRHFHPLFFINYGGILAHARIISNGRAPERLIRTADNSGIV